MLDLNGWYGPVGFALRMLEHSCWISVRLLMDKALQFWVEEPFGLQTVGLPW